MSVVVATAYMEEAERFDWLVAMDAGKILATGTPAELKARSGAQSVEDAFISLLPAWRRAGHRTFQIPPRQIIDDASRSSWRAASPADLVISPR